MQYTLSILVENQAGVLSKISGLFSRRSFNIDSLAVGVTADPSVSRITVVEQLEKQLNKLIPVIKVKRLTEGEFISRELSLIKVHCSTAKRFELIKIADVMGAKIVDIGSSTVTFEYCETADKIQTLIDLLKPYGIREIVRTGTVAIDKGKAQVTT
jgi:acetolactate synthase-1/3 small subunit